MNEHELSADLRALHVQRTQLPEPPELRQRVGALSFDDIPQRRSWLPRTPKWRFQSMYSALKFIAAGVIVALFGGFLLAGVLTTQQDGTLPAAVTESPSPMTTEELLSGMVTEEVEPGVFRVVNDGVRDVSFPAGKGWGYTGFDVGTTPDGSVWLSRDLGSHGLYRLGEEPVFEDVEGFPFYREAAPDGSLWAIGEVSDDRSGIYSFDGEDRTVRVTTTDSLLALAVGPDGTVWVAAEDEDKYCPDIEDEDCIGTALHRLEDDGSLTTIEDWSDVHDGEASPYQLAVSPDGDVWLVGIPRYQRPHRAELLLRFDGEGWEAIPGPEGWDPDELGQYLDFGPDGTLWMKVHATGGLARFDDPGWTTFTETDGLQPWGWMREVPADVLDIAADGSLWLRGNPTEGGCGGVGHYHGTTWTSYLADYCVHDFAIAPDDSVWLGADPIRWDSGNENVVGQAGLYVITPEAVAAKQQ